MLVGLGTVRPCCDPSISAWSAFWSDTCDYCTTADLAAQQAALANPNNQGNTSGVPNCDPNASLLSNLFSNTCNTSVPDAISQAVGAPFSVPAYVWWSLLGVGAFVFFKK